jgi:type II secretion system protein I
MKRREKGQLPTHPPHGDGLGIAGFSLIEVLVAMTIFAIVSLAVSKLMFNATAMISKNEAESQAIAFAQQAMENLRTMKFANLANGSSTNYDGKGRRFDVVWTVTPDTPAVFMDSVVVTVSWQEKGATESYELQNIFTQISNNS